MIKMIEDDQIHNNDIDIFDLIRQNHYLASVFSGADKCHAKVTAEDIRSYLSEHKEELAKVSCFYGYYKEPYDCTPLLYARFFNRDTRDTEAEQAILFFEDDSVNYVSKCTGKAYIHELCSSTDSRMEPILLKKLILAGADVNLAVGKSDGYSGEYPLYISEYSRHPLYIEELLNAGADPNALNTRQQETVLHRICKTSASQHTRIKMAEILLRHGADLSIKNAKGKTPLDVCKSTELKKYIEEYSSLREPAGFAER